MARICVDCRKSMIPEVVDGIAVDVCGDCGGIWFDQGELGRLMHQHPGSVAVLEDQALPHAEPRPGAHTTRSCPCCGDNLAPYHYLYSSPVMLDSCNGCGGIWVDDGELRKIEQWVQSTRNPAADERVREEAALTMAQFQIEHDDFMRRQRAIRTFLGLFRRRPFGYWLGW